MYDENRVEFLYELGILCCITIKWRNLSIGKWRMEMKVIIIGASGTIGTAVAKELEQKHEIIRAGRNGLDVTVDITSVDSIKNMYKQIGKVDAVISTTGGAHFGPVSELTPVGVLL
jgi:NADP-dependent 3-hydroxy acid dehydrogenase YdfG